MSNKTYTGITEQVFDCVKAKSAKEHGTVYDPPDADQGTATTKIKIVGTVVLTFSLDRATSTITYTLVKKPGLVPESTVWNGIQSTIAECTA